MTVDPLKASVAPTELAGTLSSRHNKGNGSDDLNEGDDDDDDDDDDDLNEGDDEDDGMLMGFSP